MTAKTIKKAVRRSRKLRIARPLSGAERKANLLLRRAEIGELVAKALKKVNWERRNKCETDPVEFAREYCVGEGGFLETPPPPEMECILWEMDESIGDSSIPYHIRIARGHGKTSYTKCIIKKAIAYGSRRFVVSVAASGDNAKEIIEDIYTGLIKNKHFVQDFPEIAIPLIESDGTYQKALNQTAWGKKTNARKTASMIVLPTINNPETGKPFPSSGAILMACGFSSGARGKVKMTQRPDCVLFDDLQTDDLAGNETRVLAAAQKIKKTFLGLAGHRKKIAAVMTSTPIEPNDLSEFFAKDKGWKTSTYPMLISWPKCFHKEKVRDLWEEYNDLFQVEKLEGRKPHLAANRFYRENRAAMDEGAKVLNPHNFDRKTEVSGIQHAMNLLFRDGADAFMCEYQMQPPEVEAAFEITAQLILSRVRKGVPPNTLPPNCVLAPVATDINPGYGLTTAGIGFDINLTGLIPFYHVHPCHIPDKLNDVEFNRRVYEELAKVGRELAALGLRFDFWGVDAGGKQFQAVTQFAPMSEAVCGIKATPMLGRAGRNWNPNVKSRIRHAVNDTVWCRDPQRRTWLAFNADPFKEKAQKALGAEVGAPGGLSLFDGGVNHFKFATQVANEKIISKTQVGDRIDTKWESKNPHDFLDCLAMCYAYAASVNLTGAGVAPKVKTTTRVKVGGIASAPATNTAAESVAASSAAAVVPKTETPAPTIHRIKIGHA